MTIYHKERWHAYSGVNWYWNLGCWVMRTEGLYWRADFIVLNPIVIKDAKQPLFIYFPIRTLNNRALLLISSDLFYWSMSHDRPPERLFSGGARAFPFLNTRRFSYKIPSRGHRPSRNRLWFLVRFSSHQLDTNQKLRFDILRLLSLLPL